MFTLFKSIRPVFSIAILGEQIKKWSMNNKLKINPKPTNQEAKVLRFKKFPVYNPIKVSLKSDFITIDT